METRNLKVMFAKNGQGRTTSRITLPLPWLREMGLDEEQREAIVTFDNNKIIIEKSNNDTAKKE